MVKRLLYNSSNLVNVNLQETIPTNETETQYATLPNIRILTYKIISSVKNKNIAIENINIIKTLDIYKTKRSHNNPT